MQPQKFQELENKDQFQASNKAIFNQSQGTNQLLPAALGEKRVKTATKRALTNSEANSANLAGFETKYRANGFVKVASNDEEAAAQIMQRYRGMEGSLYT